MMRIKAQQAACAWYVTRMLVGLGVVLALSGCIWVEDTQDLRAFVAERSSRPVGQIAPLPEFKPYEAFVYEGSSLRNPFTAIVAEAAPLAEDISDVAPDFERLKDYLETFALDNLAMVGTITAPGSAEMLWALVKDPRGEIHRVTVGDYLGLDHGQVLALDERRLELSEIISNGRGGWMKRPRTIILPEQ